MPSPAPSPPPSPTHRQFPGRPQVPQPCPIPAQLWPAEGALRAGPREPSGGSWLSTDLLWSHPALSRPRGCWASRPSAAASRAHALFLGLRVQTANRRRPLERRPGLASTPRSHGGGQLCPQRRPRATHGFPRPAGTLGCPKPCHVLQLRTWSSLIGDHEGQTFYPSPFTRLQSDTRPIGGKRGG